MYEPQGRFAAGVGSAYCHECQEPPGPTKRLALERIVEQKSDPAGGLPERDPTKLGHQLRNSTTVLLGLVERLDDLKADLPPLEDIARDLSQAAEQIQVVAQTLSRMGKGS